MDILTPQEIDNLVASLVQRYKDAINRESAYEILSNRMNQVIQNPTTAPSSNGRQPKPERNV